VTTTQAATPVGARDRAWRIHGAALSALVLLILLAFRHDVAEMVTVWWIYPTYSHAFLIVPISLWLVWEKRAQLRQIQPVVEPHGLWALPVMLFVWWMGDLSTINELKQFAIVGMVIASIFAMLGRQVFKVIWFPVLYLFFMVPTGQYLVAPMQRFATKFTDLGLTLLRIPHYTHGTFIDVSNGLFEVAEACAGLRFMIATVALGVIFAYISFRKWYKIALFMLSCVIIPLIGNGLRVLGIIVLAHYTNNRYGAGADHVVYGWGFNIAILLVLFLIGSFFRDPISDRTSPAAISPGSDSLTRTCAVFVASVVLIFSLPAYSSWHETQTQAADVSGLTNPLIVPGWRSVQPIGDWAPDYSRMAARLTLSIVPDGSTATVPVDLYIAYYADARTGHELTAHIDHLWNAKTMTLLMSRRVGAQLQGRSLQMQEMIVTSPVARRVIWSTYWIDGRFTASSFETKLLQVPAALSGHEGQAIVAVSTIVDTTEKDARQRLRAALLALRDLPDRLSAVGRRPSGASVTN
jgi:exosortase A